MADRQTPGDDRVPLAYQYDYTSNALAQQHMYDSAERRQKAEKVVAVLKDFLGDCARLSVLDMSCSAGLMTLVFAEHFGAVTGIDIDAQAVANAKGQFADRDVDFLVMDALHTSFDDNSFDVIVCNQMYEHVPDAEQLMREIFRLLKPGGVCYFSGTNRLKIVETHYGRIPFLSYLPKPLAHLYLRALGRGNRYYETFRTYWGLKALTSNFERIDYTVAVVREPERFHLTDMLDSASLRRRLALMLLRYAYWFSPGYIWLLRKPQQTS